MLRLVLRTFFDRWPLFVGTILAVSIGVALIHGGLEVQLATEHIPADLNAEKAEAFRQAASGANTLTGLSGMLSAFLTVFVVASTFNFALEQRRAELAVLRLSGVTARQLRGLVLLEAVVAAVIGTACGALLGEGLAQVQRFLLVKLGTLPADFPLHFQPRALVVDAVLAVTVCLFGAWSTARRSTRIRPLNAMRRNEERQNPVALRNWLSATVALSLTAVQVYFSAVATGMLVPLLLGLGITITASIALSNLAPLLVPAVARLLASLAGRSPVTDLAVSHLRDSVSRTTSCSAPMIVLVSLVAGLQGILDTQTQAGAAEKTRLLRADLVATGEHMDLRAVQAIPGIALAAPETVVPLAVRLKTGGEVLDGQGTVIAVDPAAFRKTHLLRPATGDLNKFGRSGIVFGSGLEQSQLRDHYDQITVSVAGRKIDLQEAARMPETPAGTDGFYIDRALLPAGMLSGTTQVMLQLSPGGDITTIKDSLRRAGATTIQTPAALAHLESRTKDAENRGVMLAIVGLGSLYALISLLSTVALSISQRRSEFSTLRLSGLTRAQIIKANTLEVLAASGIGLLLGAAAAVLALVGLWSATARIYGSPVVAIPWVLLLSLCLVTFFLVAFTVFQATRRATSGPALRGFDYQGSPHSTR